MRRWVEGFLILLAGLYIIFGLPRLIHTTTGIAVGILAFLAVVYLYGRFLFRLGRNYKRMSKRIDVLQATVNEYVAALGDTDKLHAEIKWLLPHISEYASETLAQKSLDTFELVGTVRDDFTQRLSRLNALHDHVQGVVWLQQVETGFNEWLSWAKVARERLDEVHRLTRVHRTVIRVRSALDTLASHRQQLQAVPAEQFRQASFFLREAQNLIIDGDIDAAEARLRSADGLVDAIAGELGKTLSAQAEDLLRGPDDK